MGHSIRSWLRLVDVSSRCHLFGVFRDHIASKGTTPFVAELCVNSHSGSAHCILLTGKVIQWHGERPVQMIGTYLDITAQKQANKDLQHVKDFLHKTNQTAHVGGWELDIDTDKLFGRRLPVTFLKYRMILCLPMSRSLMMRLILHGRSYWA